MENYSIGELSIAIVSIIGAVGGCLIIVERSRCKVIEACCCKIERDVSITTDLADGSSHLKNLEEPEK
jgi:hypothetical protein